MYARYVEMMLGSQLMGISLLLVMNVPYRYVARATITKERMAANAAHNAKLDTKDLKVYAQCMHKHYISIQHFHLSCS